MALHPPLSDGPAGPALVALSARGSTDYLAFCAGPALAAKSVCHSMDCLFFLFWFCSRCPKGHLSDDPLLPRGLLPAGLGRSGEEGPALPLRSSALAAALAFLDVGWAARQGLLSSVPLTLLTPLPTPPPPPSSPLASPCHSMRGQAMLCPCPPRTI